MTDEEWAAWPDCPIEGCPNKICLALDSQFCFPHTPGNVHVKHLKIEAQHPGQLLANEPELIES